MIRAIGAYTLSECMEIMAQSVAESEKQNAARRNIVFCEDRLTLIAERAMTQKLGGSFRSYVTTYARALKSRGRVLSKQGSVMVIDGIVSALQKEGRLKRFSRGGMPRGTAKSLYETIAQSASSSVDAQTLKESAERLESGILKDKISDIAEIYAEYETFLKQNGYVDESGYLALLPEYLTSTGELEGANVYFLCYGSGRRHHDDGFDALRGGENAESGVLPRRKRYGHFLLRQGRFLYGQRSFRFFESR